jgi:hypothetical protein
MHEHSDPLSPRSITAGLLVGLVVTVLGGVAVHLITRQKSRDELAAARALSSVPTPSAGPEFRMNAALASAFGVRYRVMTDDESHWDKYVFDTFIKPRREKSKYYPFIVIGDFDGDKVSDVAALVRNTDNNYLRLGVLWGRSGELTFYDGQLCEGISFTPANEWKSHWEKAAITLPSDAITVICYEKSSWLLYWNGRAFQQYWMTD